MRTSRRFLAIGVLLLTPVLVACGDDGDGDGDRDGTTPSASVTDSPTEATTAASTDATTATATTAAADELPPASEVVTSADVAAAFGVPFGDPALGGGGHTEQDIAWQSDDCNFEAEDLVQVDLALTGPDDFRTGAFQCPEPAGIAATVTPVDVPGALEAWWEVDDAPPLEATLRVCTEAYNFDLGLDYEDGVDFEGDPQAQAIVLAGVVLAKLG